jgi:mRNA interferase RelE/StbE
VSYWRLEYDPDAVRCLRQADPQIARRIRDALTAVVRTGDPRGRGRALTGQLGGLWRHRVGDCRIICDIQDHRVVVLALDIGNRDRDHIYDWATRDGHPEKSMIPSG